MEQRTKIRNFISLTILCSRLKQDTNPSKRDREREREPWRFGEREEVSEKLNIHPQIFPGTKHYNL